MPNNTDKFHTEKYKKNYADHPRHEQTGGKKTCPMAVNTPQRIVKCLGNIQKNILPSGKITKPTQAARTSIKKMVSLS